jgi:hypothetical protein
LPNGNRKKKVVDNIQAIKTEIEDFKYEAERAERGITEKVAKFVMEK